MARREEAFGETLPQRGTTRDPPSLRQGETREEKLSPDVGDRDVG